MKIAAGFAIALMFVLTAGDAVAGGSKGKDVPVSFHIETEGADNPKMIFPHEVMGNQRFFRRLPEISSKDYVAFSPFPSEDQQSYGVVLQLKDHARTRLAAVTTNSSGKWLVCMAFGRVIDGVLVDEPVDDGVIVVWKGLTLDEIHLLDQAIPRIGGKKK